VMPRTYIHLIPLSIVVVLVLLFWRVG
jgi:hypothetical protein